MKSVQIQSFFWSLFFCIRTEWTRKNSVFGHFSTSGMDKEHEMHSKSDNVEFMVYDEADEVIEKGFE